MIARKSDADINVVALIGERGREVKEFVEDALGPEGMKKSVLVCSTGDQPPLIRQKCLLFLKTDMASILILMARRDSQNRFSFVTLPSETDMHSILISIIGSLKHLWIIYKRRLINSEPIRLKQKICRSARLLSL